MKYKPSLKFLFFPLAFFLLYHEVIRHMFNKWLTPEGSHGPLIVLVSLYLIWIKRKDVKNTPASPGQLPGSILLTLGCFMLFAGKLSSTMLIQQLSMIPVLLGTIWLLWGFNHFKIFLLPVGYLMFLTGFIEELFGSISIYLQLISARISYHIFEIVGVTVLLTGTILELPHISLEVARSCSGINHIVSLLIFTVAFAHFRHKTFIKKCILIFAAVFIGIFANGLRISLIGIYAGFNPGRDIHGPFETLYVSFIFFFGLAMIIVMSLFLKKLGPREENVTSSVKATPSECSVERQACEEYKKVNQKPVKYFAPAISMILIFAVTFGMLNFYQPRPVQLKNSLETLPFFIGSFSGNDLEKIDNRIRPFSADDELIRVYENAEGNKFEVYVGFFKLQIQDKRIIDYRRDWMHENVQKMRFSEGSEIVTINKTLTGNGIDPVQYYFWYFMDGKIITSRYAGKFFTFWSGLTKRKTNAAIIIIRTKNTENEDLIFLEDFMPMIHNHMTAI